MGYSEYYQKGVLLIFLLSITENIDSFKRTIFVASNFHLSTLNHGIVSNIPQIDFNISRMYVHYIQLGILRLTNSVSSFKIY